MSKAGVPVKITLKTKMDHNGSIDAFELICFGQYYIKNNTAYLIYDEVTKKGTIHTIVKYSENKDIPLQLLRRGSLNMRMSFMENKNLSGTYKTDIGTFIVSTDTQSLKYHWDEKTKQGKIDIKYRFYMEQEKVGNYHLSFTFKEEKKK